MCCGHQYLPHGLGRVIELILVSLTSTAAPCGHRGEVTSWSSPKTATASLLTDYVPHTEEPLPIVGQRYRIVGFDDETVGIVETTELVIVPAAKVDLQFARDEGEGFETVADWRTAHERFWSDRKITDETPIVCQRFRLVRC